MHITVTAAATVIFPVKLGLRLEPAKSIPKKMTGKIKFCASKLIMRNITYLWNKIAV
jgi:hypothetical protein